MATLIPTSQPTGVEAYEDMFKEITRKLYGDESGHGLYPHNTQVAQVAQLASGAPAAPEGGERSFTTLVSDRNIAQIDYETTTVQIQQQQQQGGGAQQQQSGGTFKSEEHLTTAFGLAALMQNGFPPPGAILNPVNFPVGTTLKPSTNIAIATADDRWQQQTQQTQPQDQQQQSVGQDHTWTPNGKQSSSSSYSQKAFKKPKIEPQDGSPTGTIGTVSTLNIPQTGSDKNKANFGSAAVGAATGKRYSCTSCPYTTDRRDLFTRHENIHKEEKPFHCYACLKQFNRADHVKKHFLRMHRDMEYEIAKTRKSVNAKNNYYNNNTSASSSGNNATVSTTVTQSLAPQPTTIIQTSNNTLNIPTATFPTQITIPTHHGNAIEHTVSHDIATLNGVVHHVQQQQQQQHQHQQQQQSAPPPHQPTQIVLGPPIVTIKQEKGGAITTTTTTATAAAVAAATAIVNNSAQQQRGDIVATVGPEELLPNDDKSLVKKLKGEKRFTCCYCPWSGADNWGLKRHLNTHTKPFVCMLCDYKAARSERLATHVFKVHNKKACNKCNYFADDETQLNTHLLEAHLLNMQAIGRNKASVTQDFHNAGGGNQHHHFSNSHSSTNGTNKLSLLVAASSSASCSPSGSPSPPLSRLSPPTMVPLSTTTTTTQAGGGGAKIPIANGMAMANLTEEHLSLLQLLATAAVAQQHLQQQQQQLQQKNATSTSISTSPPANHPHQQPNNYNHHQNSTNSNVTSDPANNNGSKQRRRKSSSRNDKENLVQRHPTATVVPGGKVIDLTTGSTTHGTTNGPAENGIERNNNGSSNNNNSSVNNKNINEAIFDRVYKKPYNMFLTSAFCKPSPIEKDRAAPKDENFSLSEFLRNHKEVSISTLSDVRPVKPRGVALDGGPVDEDDVIFIKEEKRLGRKQQQPRRNLALDTELNASPLNISYKPPSGTTPDRPQIGDIRDKHMIRLISRKLCCRICQNQQRLEHMDNCHYHSKTSLILHNRWRHGSWPRTEHCKLCRASFDRKYKLVLHLRLQHTRRRLSPLALKSKSKSKKDPSGHKRKATSGKKQQRKRKSKSRSGSKHGTVKRRK
ncbi:protein charlatan isoform X4 [Aedes aegypti]|uniref:C2H2-type domain-containing protein n=1 Tax=Aedes aegypti TaxID=7159 RepID=A0A6I8TNP8_AEDAE|nr:protein charlatan isoform X4 [Aedes aegypti]